MSTYPETMGSADVRAYDQQKQAYPDGEVQIIGQEVERLHKQIENLEERLRSVLHQDAALTEVGPDVPPTRSVIEQVRVNLVSAIDRLMRVTERVAA